MASPSSGEINRTSGRSNRTSSGIDWAVARTTRHTAANAISSTPAKKRPVVIKRTSILVYEVAKVSPASVCQNLIPMHPRLELLFEHFLQSFRHHTLVGWGVN